MASRCETIVETTSLVMAFTAKFFISGDRKTLTVSRRLIVLDAREHLSLLNYYRSLFLRINKGQRFDKKYSLVPE